MTSISVPIVHPRITEYLNRLDAAVASFPHAEACDIVSEIRAYISDALAEDTSDAGVDRVLASLGSPELLAENFRTELVFARAAHSFSPRLLLRTAWRWGRSGGKGSGRILQWSPGLCGRPCIDDYGSHETVRLINRAVGWTRNITFGLG